MDTKYNRLFEGVDLSKFTPDEIIQGKKVYDYIVESAEIAKEENKPLSDVMDEGILAAIAGGLSGAIFAPALGNALSKVLGLQQGGALHSLLTSRVVMAAICAELGLRY
jgi:uncharacterized membrane protein YeaQ/YmgE (transglycosylase-associated protein family)